MVPQELLELLQVLCKWKYNQSTLQVTHEPLEWCKCLFCSLSTVGSSSNFTLMAHIEHNQIGDWYQKISAVDSPEVAWNTWHFFPKWRGTTAESACMSKYHTARNIQCQLKKCSTSALYCKNRKAWYCSPMKRTNWPYRNSSFDMHVVRNPGNRGRL